MAVKEITALMQLGGGIEAEWNLLEVPIPNKVMAFAIDTKIIKIGDGTTLFKDLPVFFDMNKMGTATELMNNFPDPVEGVANKIVVVNPTGDGYVVSDVGIDDLVKTADLNSLLTNKAPLNHTHDISDITGLMSAATKDAGAAPGNVPVIQTDGKILSSLVPPVTAENVQQDNIISYLLTAQLAADDKVALNLTDGFVDAYEDTSRVDLDASVNATFDTDHFTGTNMELVSEVTELIATPTEARLYLNLESDGVGNKDVLAEVSRDDGVTWAAVLLEKQRMSTDTIDVYIGSSNFDKELTPTNVDLSTAEIEDIKGDVTTFTVDTENTSGHVDSAIVQGYLGCEITLEDETVLAITKIITDGTANDDIEIDGVIATGTYNIDKITGIKFNNDVLGPSNPDLINGKIVDGVTFDSQNNTPIIHGRTGHTAVNIGDKLFILGGYNGRILDGLWEYNLNTHNWVKLDNPIGTRYNHAAEAIDGKMYVFGGVDKDGVYYNDLWVYDPEENTWEQLTSGATVRRYASACTDGTILYIIGGDEDGGGSGLLDIWSYNPGTDSWTLETSDQGYNFYAQAATYWNGKLYMGGGYIYENHGNDKAYLHVYDIETHTGSDLTGCLKAYVWATMVAINNKLYVYGYGDTYIYVYDISEDSWEQLADTVNIPYIRSGHAACVIDGEMYVIGGTYNTMDVIKYTPDDDSWLQYNTKDVGRRSQATTVVGDKMYIFGGTDRTGNVLNDFWAYDLLSDQWEQLSYGPSIRSSASIVEINNKLYLFGGSISSTNRFNDLWRYDIGEKTWAELSSGATDRSGHTAVVINSVMYVYGGMNSVAEMLNDVWKYDPSNGSWTQLTGGAGVRNGHSAVAISDKMYVYGGVSGGSYLNTLYEYNTLNDTWTQLATNATDDAGRHAHSAVVYNDKMYVYGGYRIGAYLNTVHVYDPVGDSWTTATSSIDKRVYHRSIVYQDKMYVYGGDNSFIYLNDLLEYDFILDSWMTVSKPHLRTWHSSVVIDNEMYIFGGEGTGLYFGDLWKYDPSVKDWTQLASHPTKTITNHTAVAINGLMYVFGGYDGSVNIGDLWVYDPSDDSWTQLTGGPVARYGHTAVAINGLMYVFGGSTGTALNDLWSYDPSDDSWTQLTAGATTRLYHKAEVINNKMYIFGGVDKNDLWVYDPAGAGWSDLTSNPTVADKPGICTIGGMLYSFGGYDGGADSYLCYMYNPTNDTWTELFNLPDTHTGQSVSVIGNVAYVFGGKFKGYESDIFYTFALSHNIGAELEFDIVSSTAILTWTPGNFSSIYSTIDFPSEINSAIKMDTGYYIYVNFAWKMIARYNVDTWEYLDVTETWQSASSNAEMVAISEALDIVTNQGFTIVDLEEVKLSIMQDLTIGGIAMKFNSAMISEVITTNISDVIIPDGTDFRYRVRSTDDIELTAHSARVQYS